MSRGLEKLRVPAELRGVAAGDPDAVKERLPVFVEMHARSVDKPWLARALLTEEARSAATQLPGARAAIAATELYAADLAASVANVREAGVLMMEPVNIRTGRQGWGWGAPAAHSHILPRLGDAARAGIENTDVVAERWYGSDDPQYPGWGSAPVAAAASTQACVPLSWLISELPEACLGAAHVAAFGAGRGVIMKDLDAARPLSWQVHIGVEEGYEVQKMPAGTGLFLGVNEPERSDERVKLVQHVRAALQRDLDRPAQARRVLRLDAPVSGIETPPILTQGLPALVEKLLAAMPVQGSIGDLLAFLLTEGINVVDPAGFAWTADDRFFPGFSLVQIYKPEVGARVVIREGKSHALFGWTAERGEDAIGWFKEFKATATGPRYDTVATGDQTWSLADTLLGARPRPGKVVSDRLEEAIRVIRDAGAWRKLSPVDIAAAPSAMVELADDVVAQQLHAERQFAAVKLGLGTVGSQALFRRHGCASVLVVAEGAIRVKRASDGRVLCERLGLTDGWNGTAASTDEAFVLAEQGDLVLECVSGPAVVYDAVRPVPGVRLPEFTRVQE